MKAMLYENFNTAPKIASVPDPTPTADGIVVRVEATGICRSDWHGWVGHADDIALPHVPGHEFAGVVEATGKNVTRFKRGDRVTAPFIAACGTCHECNSGNQQTCLHQTQAGFSSWGSFAEYVAVECADTNMVHLPESIDFVTAASLGCRFATSFRAVVDQGKVRGGEWLVVHGAGGIGLAAIMIAKAFGSNVIAVDIVESKLDFARQIGADYTVNSRTSSDHIQEILEITKGGAHVSIDALGNPKTSYNSIKNLRPRGRHVQVGLIIENAGDSYVPMYQVMAKELEVYGSHGMQAWRYDDMLRMITNGSLKPEKLIGKTVSLENGIQHLTSMADTPDTGIVVIDRF
ncbi:zinc-dependent alcohol dehydrogenase family protein [Sinorhizobium meliloti]|uniref:zinc-dependent alcohol dehydrogenase family protein n=1 Tax=Rhizobium meliloti TaxID=382 RepID=UPI003D66181A